MKKCVRADKWNLAIFAKKFSHASDVDYDKMVLTSLCFGTVY